jgi:hypothetical protein
MNEQIRELAIISGLLFQRDKLSYEEKKFAELIVFECIKLAVFKGDATTGKAIKEHFGVEDET